MTKSTNAYRTPQQQEERNNLAKKLQDFRSQGNEWREIAQTLLANEQKTEQYQKAKEKRSLEKIFHDMDTLLDQIDALAVENKDKDNWHRKSAISLQESFWKDALYLFHLMRDKGVEKNLTDEQQKTMQRMISFCIQDDYEKKLYTWASGTLLNDYNGSLDLVGNNIGINFLKQNFDTFDQATKESFIWEAITQSELQENYYSLENDIRRYPNWNYPEKPKKDSFQGFPQLYTMAAKSVDHGNNGQKFLFSSNNSVYPLVKQTLEDSTNEEFIFDVALILAERHDTQIIPKKHYELLKNPQKIEQFVTPEKLKKFWVSTNNFFAFLKELWTKISWGKAKFFTDSIKTTWNSSNPAGGYNKRENRFENSRREIKQLWNKVIDMDTVKQSLEQKIKTDDYDYNYDREPDRWNFQYNYEWYQKALEEYNKSDHKLVKGEEFRRFLSFFHKADLLQLLDESYKTPEFLNAKLTELNNKNSESQNDIRALFKDDSWKDAIKYLLNHLKEKGTPETKFDGRLFDQSNISPELILDTIEIDTIRTTIANYKEMKKRNIDTKPYIGKLMEKISGSKIDHELLQDVIDTWDEKVVGSLFFKIAPTWSEDDVNILVSKQLNQISSEEDYNAFEKVMKQNEERSNLLLYIDFLLTGSTGSTERKSVPLSVYKEMIVNGDFNQIKGEIPKVVPNPQVDMNDIQRISQIYTVRQERLAKESKEKEEAARIASEQSKIRREKEKKEKAEFNTALKENWEQGTVNLDYTKNNQKFVVSVDPDKKAVVFSSKFLPFHADIHHTYVKNGYCLGGGRMYIDEHKNIRLYSSSESYGSVPEEFQSTVEKILKKQYPEANIKRNYPKIYGEKREPRSEY